MHLFTGLHDIPGIFIYFIDELSGCHVKIAAQDQWRGKCCIPSLCIQMQGPFLHRCILAGRRGGIGDPVVCFTVPVTAPVIIRDLWLRCRLLFQFYLDLCFLTYRKLLSSGDISMS